MTKLLILITKTNSVSESITSNEGQRVWKCVYVCKYAGELSAASLLHACPAPVVATPSPLHSRLLTHRSLAASLSHLAAGRLARRAALFRIQNYSQFATIAKTLCAIKIFFFRCGHNFCLLQRDYWYIIKKLHAFENFVECTPRCMSRARFVMRTPYWRSRWRRAVPPYLSRPPTSKINR